MANQAKDPSIWAAWDGFISPRVGQRAVTTYYTYTIWKHNALTIGCIYNGIFGHNLKGLFSFTFWSIFAGKKVLVQSCLGPHETYAAQSGFEHLSALTTDWTWYLGTNKWSEAIIQIIES